MKKLMLIFFTCCCALFFTGSAIALDVGFSGSYLAEGFLHSSVNLDDNDASNQFRNMRLRVKTDFNVTETLTLTTRFDALEKVWGSDDEDSGEDNDNIDLDRAYMTIKTKVGLFQVGRMKGSTWGTSWSDYESNADRIKYVLPMDAGNGKIYAFAVLEKSNEFDGGPNSNGLSDADNDKYYLGAAYKEEKMSFGLLSVMYNFNTFQDPDQKAATDAVAAGTPNASDLALLGERGIATKGTAYALVPYFKGDFNNFGLSTELVYYFGNTEYDTNAEDLDISAFSFNLEGTYDVGQFALQLGYGQYSGDSDTDDGEVSAIGYIAPNENWEKAYILGSGGSINGKNNGLNTTMANGVGNHVGGGFGSVNEALLDGFQMIYVGADFKASDDLTIGCIIANSKADSVPSGVDDDQGTEVDLNLKWEIMDNLNFEGIAAFLAAGDYWKDRGGIADNDFTDIYSFYGGLNLTF